MTEIRRLARRAVSLSTPDWRYLAQAVWELGVARLQFGARSGLQIVETLRAADASQSVPARSDLDLPRLSWALNVAAERVPWRSDCLIRAMAASRWLRRHGYQTEFHLGVARPHSGSAMGHAWLSCNGASIVGGSGVGYRELV